MLSLQGGYEEINRDNSMYAPANEIVFAINEEVGGMLNPNIQILYRQLDDMGWQYKQSVYYGTEGAKPLGRDGTLPLITNGGKDDKTIEYRPYGAAYTLTDIDIDPRIWVEKRVDFEMFLRNSLVATVSQLNKSFFDVLNRGWEDEYVNVWGETVQALDLEGSQPLFSTAHKIKKGTGETYTYNNVILNYSTAKINPPFSQEAVLHTQEYTSNLRDEQGNFANVSLDTLLIPTAMKAEVLQYLKSTYEPFNANNGTNEINALTRGGSLGYICERELDGDGQGNSTNAVTGSKYAEHWYLFDSRNIHKTFGYSFLEFPSIGYIKQEGDYSRKYGYRLIYRLGFFDTRYIFGSNGLNQTLPTALVR